MDKNTEQSFDEFEKEVERLIAIKAELREAVKVLEEQDIMLSRATSHLRLCLQNLVTAIGE